VLLRRYRLAAGLSQEELAERARLSVHAVSVLERGRRQVPYRGTVGLLVTALGLSPEEAAALEATVPRRRGPRTPVAAGAARSAAGAAEGTSPPPPPPTNLPLALTSFVGRRREQDAVRALLGRSRLVTLTGAGGAGKTRLALALADELLGEYPDGAWFVELAPLSDPSLVPGAAAAALGLREEPGRPVQGLLLAYLTGKHLLLLLDNCEHLVAACAALAAALLGACPRVRILATSREGLGVPGERLYRVPSLAVPRLDQLPPPEELGAYPAVRLFVARAQERWADFALTEQNARAVASICARLDGMPLAVELAAARAGSLPLEAIAARLDDRFRLLTGGPRTALPRQQALRATLDWSYGLLSGGEQRLLDRLSVFAGGWTLSAAEVICSGEGIEVGEVLDLLGNLVNKSLVQCEEASGDGRFGLLETVRQYAWERLKAAGEDVRLQERHLSWHRDLVEQAETELSGATQALRLRQLHRELDNLRAALRWANARHDSASGLRLAAGLWLFWFKRSLVREGRQWLESLLVEASSVVQARDTGAPHAASYGEQVTHPSTPGAGPVPEALLARAHAGAGALAGWSGDYERSKAHLEAALALWGRLQDKAGLAETLNHLGSLVAWRTEFERSTMFFEQSLALRRELGDTWGIARALNNLGEIVLAQGDLERARSLFDASLPLTREVGDTWSIAQVLHNLGEIAYYQAEYPQAQARCEESLALYRAVGEDWGTAATLNALGRVARAQAQLTDALRRYRESLALSRRWGSRKNIAYSLEGIAATLLGQQCGDQAARLLGAAATVRSVDVLPIMPIERPELAAVLRATHRALGDPAFERAWLAGQAMPLADALALALGEVM
jgi:predicted ATPase